MSHSPLVSVIVCVHNQQKFIGRCLRSLIAQSLDQASYEIIVVDDGSTDLTPYALNLFAGAITVITNETNIGLPASINRGIEAAAGEYIIRVDSDDYVNAHFLLILSLYLQTNDGVHAVACDYYMVNDKEDVLRRCDARDAPIACGIMFMRAALEKIGLYDESFRWNEEKELRIRFEKEHILEHIAMPLYRYRRHESNMTNDTAAMMEHQQRLEQKHGVQD